MMLMRSSPSTTEQMLVALCPLKPTNPKPRGPPRRAALWLRKNPQLRSSFIADDNEQYRPKIAGGDFLPGVHIRVGGFADVSQSNGKRKITIYPVFRVLYLTKVIRADDLARSMVVPLFTAAVFPDAILRLHHSDFPQARFWITRQSPETNHGRTLIDGAEPQKS